MRLALACAALLLTLSCAQHVSFREMSSNGKATGVKFDTGYEERVLQYIWRTYRTRLVNAVRGYEGFRVVGNGGEQMLAAHVGLCLYAALWYIHIYPTTDAIGGWEFGKRYCVNEVTVAPRVPARTPGTLERKLLSCCSCCTPTVSESDTAWIARYGNRAA